MLPFLCQLPHTKQFRIVPSNFQGSALKIGLQRIHERSKGSKLHSALKIHRNSRNWCCACAGSHRRLLLHFVCAALVWCGHRAASGASDLRAAGCMVLFMAASVSTCPRRANAGRNCIRSHREEARVSAYRQLEKHNKFYVALGNICGWMG